MSQAQPSRYENSSAPPPLEAKVDIDPGATFEVPSGGGIEVASGSGQLVASGTSDNNVEFVGTTDTKGHWKGIRIHSENDNELTHAVVSDGGSTTFNKANVGVGIDSAGSATIENCELSDSDGWGVLVASGSSVTASNNTYTNNAEGDIDRPGGTTTA